MYPKDRLPRGGKAAQMPPNLATLFAHIMRRTAEVSSSRGSCNSHNWDEVLQPPSGSSDDPGPYPMSAQDWRKAEAFGVQLQALISARNARCTANGKGRNAAGQNDDSSVGSSSSSDSSSVTASHCAQAPAAGPAGGKPVPYANGKAKGKARPPQVTQLAQAAGHPSVPQAGSTSNGTATPAPSQVTMPRQSGPRVTPKEPSRACGEPSAPTKVVSRVAAARRVNGAAEGAIATLAVSRAGPGAFETPSHSHQHMKSPGEHGEGGAHTRDRDASPSRYPARLRSRRFPPLGGSGDAQELTQLVDMGMGIGHGGDKIEEEGDPPNGSRRLSPRHSHDPLPCVGGGRSLPTAEQHYPNGWDTAADDELSARVDQSDDEEAGDDSYGMRSRALLKPAGHLMGSGETVTLGGAVTPKPSAVNTAAPPVHFGAVRTMTSSDAPIAVVGGPSAKTHPPPRPRQVLQGGGGRSGSRAPMPRSSVGGRNYTDNHVKQLALIEAAVVASATPQDKSTYNLPRQGRTLTLTNVFKFVALRGAGTMYALAHAKQVEAHTGRHSNFFDGKIDARIVGIIKRDIGDEAITKSRKFSKILLSLVAEGCTSPDCDWEYNTFTTENVARMQARIEAETGTSALEHVINSASIGSSAAASTAAAPPLPPSSPLGAAIGGGAGASGGPAKAGPSKRRLDLGRDEGQTPSPRAKKLKRNARSRDTSAQSTPTSTAAMADSDGADDARSPPKEEDDMRAAEVLQGLKGVGGS